MVNYKILILAYNHLHIFLPNAEQNINWHLPPNVYRTQTVYFKDIILTSYILTFILVSTIQIRTLLNSYTEEQMIVTIFKYMHSTVHYTIMKYYF